MSTRLQRNAPLRFARTAGEAFKDASYANAVERHEGPSPLASGWFWIGGAASVLVWTGLWWLIATVLEAIK